MEAVEADLRDMTMLLHAGPKTATDLGSAIGCTAEQLPRTLCASVERHASRG